MCTFFCRNGLDEVVDRDNQVRDEVSTSNISAKKKKEEKKQPMLQMPLRSQELLPLSAWHSVIPRVEVPLQVQVILL